MDINVLLFDRFESLDVFGPVEVLSKIEHYNLNYYSYHGGMVVSDQNTIIITKPFSEMNKSGICLIPGGQGTRGLVDDFDFIESLKDIVIHASYCLSVCTGSALLAKTGLLLYRHATTNKLAFNWVCSVSNGVLWSKKARWVVDDKYYTSSGVSAGIDMALGFIHDRFGLEEALRISNRIEYVWNQDKDNDPFAIAF